MIKVLSKHESYSVDNEEKSVGSDKKMFHKKKLILVSGAFFLSVVGIAFLIWSINHNSNSGNASNANSSSVQVLKAKNVCPKDVIQEANAPIANSDQVALGGVVDKITELKDYDHDPNCLYIVLQYALASGNATQSVDYMSKLKQVYDPGIGYSNAFSIALVPLSTLDTSVNFLVQNAKDSAANSANLNKSTAAGSDAADKFQEGKK